MKQICLLLFVLGIFAENTQAQRVIEGKSDTYYYNIRKKPQKRVYTFSEGSFTIEGRSKGKSYSIKIHAENERDRERDRYWEERSRDESDRYEYRRNDRDRDVRINPPLLEIEANSLSLQDDNFNNRIDAEETVYLEFELQNRARGEAIGLEAIIHQKGKVQGLDYEQRIRLGNLPGNRVRTISIPIKGDRDLSSGTAIFEIKIDERNGFGADPFEVEINTKEAYRPLVKINDYQIVSNSRKLVKKVPFDIQLMVQNHGRGEAEDVTVDIEMPANVIMLSADEQFYLGNLKSGEAKQVEFSLIANDKYQADEIPLEFHVEERRGQFAEDKTIKLKMGQKDRTVIKVEETPTKEETKEIEVAYLGSDVDRNIPQNPQTYDNRYVLIFGNEDYTTYQADLNSEANVEYAEADAMTFARYAENVLGVPREHITIRTNAISTVMRREIRRFIDKAKYTDGEAELIFYYSGHGFPDRKTGEAYLMPVDIGGEDVIEGIQLSQLYQDLTQFPAERVTVFLDACFSGGGRNQGLLAARGIRIKPRENLIDQGNLVVFSASTGDQESLAYRSKKHGMFSYFLFKKLQENDPSLTYKELADYLNRMVPLTSSDINYKEQTPSINISRDAIGQWERWRVK